MQKKKQSLNQIRIAVMNAKGRLTMHSAEITPHAEDAEGRNWDADPVSKMEPTWRREIETLRTRLQYDSSMD
ncbi:hypothetical protein ACSBPU_13080 [Parapusillimonas sp. JC17]|uniref:hypothetical protein n=1 Tax=Parapusillimonas sp. JC17 TaxID=3445768 RepID=UPI003F9FF816